MTDIVERLRARSRFDTCVSPEQIMREGADAIERLRAENAELRKAQGGPVGVIAPPHIPHTLYSVEWTHGCPPMGTPLYTSAPSIPEGWQPVPVEPFGAALDTLKMVRDGKIGNCFAYREIIAAARKLEPTP